LQQASCCPTCHPHCNIRGDEQDENERLENMKGKRKASVQGEKAGKKAGGYIDLNVLLPIN
jgi:hypothetical protein